MKRKRMMISGVLRRPSPEMSAVGRLQPQQRSASLSDHKLNRAIGKDSVHLVARDVAQSGVRQLGVISPETQQREVIGGAVFHDVRRTANDPKLSDGGGWRGAGWRVCGVSLACAVTAVAVRCSAWLAVRLSPRNVAMTIRLRRGASVTLSSFSWAAVQ